MAGAKVHLASGCLHFRCVAVEEFELEQDERPYDLAFAVRVGALDGRHPGTGQALRQRISGALVREGDASTWMGATHCVKSGLANGESARPAV